MKVEVLRNINNFKIDFNDLTKITDILPDNVFIKRHRITVKPFDSFEIDNLRKEIKKQLNLNLLDCDIYASFSSIYGGTTFHIDEENVFILNSYGRVCYNIHEEQVHSNILEKNDAIIIPGGIAHSVHALTPRISLSFRV